MNRALTFAVALFALLEPLRADPGPDDLRPVLQAMREEISTRPSRVLIAVEDALTMNEQAACEIVKEAIISTRADAKLTGEIVFTALKHAPAMAAVIVECAMAQAPEAAAEIEKAVRRALGSATSVSDSPAPEKEAAGNESSSGKESSGKEGAATSPEEPDITDSFLPGAVGVGGIYLIAPSRSFIPCLPGDFCCSGDLSVSCLRP